MLLSPANIKKTIYYCKKNGLKDCYFATLERISQKRKYSYEYEEISPEELSRQSEEKFTYMPKISVVVPAYETKPIFIEDLILSLEEQSYSNFELIIADASETDGVEKMTKELNRQYENVNYYHLKENLGISENTNCALEYATGEYVALLDHDDILTNDALYEMVKALNKYKAKGMDPVLLFSDEDKGNGYMDAYYEPNIKGKFNKEMFMTNNYVCHLSLFKTSVIKELKFRKEYDGAQDYDILLRTLKYVEDNFGEDKVEDYIINVPKILYHWRCHESSTASNPQSKMYAYEAGRRAVESYFASKGIEVKVSHMKHLGFYKVSYPKGIFNSRKDIGVVGGPIISNHKVSGGAMDSKGELLYGGLNEHYSGLLNRAVLSQKVGAVDIRNMIIRDDLIEMFEQTTGFKYKKDGKKVVISNENGQINGDRKLSKDEIKKILEKNMIFCNKVRNKGITILYEPNMRGLVIENKG